MAPRVTIAVPTYQRPERLERCLGSLMAQTYPDLRITIADNASHMPEVDAVLERASGQDPRIEVIKRDVNIGAAPNFADLLERATTPLFMWAANDDTWAPDAVETLVGLLDRNPEARMACGGTIHFNENSRSKRPLDQTRFNSTGNRNADLRRFLMSPEIEGKSHLIYGLFHTDALKDAAAAVAFGTRARWGEDVIFCFAFLCRYPMVATKKPLLFKYRPENPVDPRPRLFSSDYSFPNSAFAEYCGGLIDACATQEQRDLVVRVMQRRKLWKRLVSSWRKPLFRPLRRLPL